MDISTRGMEQGWGKRVMALTIGAALIGSSVLSGAEKAPEATGGFPITGEMFPVCFQSGRYSVNAGFPGVLICTFKGDPKRVAGAWLALDLPSGVEFIGATTRLPTRTTDNTLAWDPEPSVTQWGIKHEGKDFTRHNIMLSIDLIRHLRPTEVLWGRAERLYLKASEGLAGKTVTVYWRLVTSEGEGPEQSFKLNVLPPLKLPTTKAQKIKLLVSKLGQATAPFPEVREAYFNYWKALAERPYTCGPDYGSWASLNDQLRDEITANFKLIPMIGALTGGTPQLSCERWLVYPKLTKADGSTIDTTICPSYLIEDPDGRIWDKFAPAAIGLRLKNMGKPEAIVWDFEPGAMDFCFCEVCRKGFATGAGLDPAPDAAEIKAKHGKKWFEFRVQQHTKINAKFADMVKKFFKGTKYWICTDNLHDGSQILSDWCGCDERQFDPDVDLHLPMIYYAGLQFFKDVALNVASLKKPVFVLVDPAEELAMFYNRYTPVKIKQNILASAANGAVGIGFWPEDNLDGEYLAQIAQGMGMLARGEDYYTAKRDDSRATVKVEPIFEKTIEDGGKKATLVVPALGDRIRYTVHHRDQNLLVTVFNYDETQDVTVRIQVPGLTPGARRVLDLEANRCFLDAERKPLTEKELASGFLARVRACGVLAVEVAIDVAVREGIPQSEFVKSLNEAKAKMAGGGALEGAIQGGVIAGWGDVNGDGVPEIKLELADGKAYVDLEKGGVITGWVDKRSGEDALAVGNDRGFLGEVVLYDAKGAVPGPLEVKALDIRDGAPRVEFIRRMMTDVAAAGADPQGGSPLEGLEIRKEIVLMDNGRSLKQTFTVTNNGSRKIPMAAGFRIKHYPRLGAAGAGGKTIAAIATVRFATPTGPKDIQAGSGASSTAFMAPGIADHPFIKSQGAFKIEPWTPGPVTVKAGDGQAVRTLAVEPEPNSAAGLYMWWGTANFTVEMLTPDLPLAPGQSATYTETLRLRTGAASKP